jgi:hypothetical protein
MRRLWPLASLALLACGRTERIDSSAQTAITEPPAYVVGVQSRLRVPAICPIWAPGGGDVDTPEPPLPAQLSALCAVDEFGGTYGIIDGDAPTARVAVIEGEREIGVYIGFHPSSASFAPEAVTVNGATPSIPVWATVANAMPAPRVAQIVAAGHTGALISMGRFDTTPTDIEFYVQLDAIVGAGGTYAGGFDVNAAP